MNLPLRTFDKFSVSYIIRGNVINKSPLRIGSGRSQSLTSAVDNPVLMLRFGEEEVPVIPGSSWKGLLRSEAEVFVRSTEGLRQEFGEVWRACNILEVVNNEELRKSEEQDPCAVCRVFGNTGIASHVRFFDSYPVSGYSLETISRVAIDRITGGQSPGKLFNVQVVSPLTQWSFEMQVLNIDLRENSPESKIISYLMAKLLTGIQIGGGKSVGYGFVKLDRDSIAVKEIRLSKGGLSSQIHRGDSALKVLGVEVGT